MLWFWGTIGLVLALVFIFAWFHDRRNGSSFGDDLQTRRHGVDARNDRSLGGSGIAGGGGPGGDGGG